MANLRAERALKALEQLACNWPYYFDEDSDFDGSLSDLMDDFVFQLGSDLRNHLKGIAQEEQERLATEEESDA